MQIAYITTIGQDSHAFVPEFEDRRGMTATPSGEGPATDVPASVARPLILGGVRIEDGTPALAGNSDADVILHAITNAISGYTGINILGGKADDLCRAGETNSAVYLQEALATLPAEVRLEHVSLSLEGSRPRLKPYVDRIRLNVAKLLDLSLNQVGLTATSGEGLTAFGRGEGIQVFCLLTLARTDK